MCLTTVRSIKQHALQLFYCCQNHTLRKPNMAIGNRISSFCRCLCLFPYNRPCLSTARYIYFGGQTSTSTSYFAVKYRGAGFCPYPCMLQLLLGFINRNQQRLLRWGDIALLSATKASLGIPKTQTKTVARRRNTWWISIIYIYMKYNNNNIYICNIR